MPDQRSVMKEYRYLDEKRLAEGLTPAEQARLEKLRVLVGPEVGAGAPKPGFDVNAAAAALRESLLPAGLRNRPPPTPVQPPPAPPAPEPAEPAIADALASEYEQSPFAPLDAPAQPPQDALFDPASLGTEPPAYDPSAPQAWDPNQPYDPNAAYPADTGYDPNAPQAWDPSQPYDPNAAYPAGAGYDPNAPQAWDPNQPYDPNAAYPADGYDPNAPQAWDPNQPYDPNAAPQTAVDSADVGYDPGAQPAWDQGQGWDTGAAPAAGEGGPETGGYADAAYGAGADQAQSWDVTAGAQPEDLAASPDTGLGEAAGVPDEQVAGEGAPPEGGSFAQDGLGSAEGWDAQPDPQVPPQDAAFGAYDETGGIEPFAPGTLGAEPPVDASAFDLGAGPSSEPASAFDLDAGSASEAAVPPTPELGEYDDTAGFAAEPFDASALPPGTPGLDAGAAELDASWQPEAALEAGFELASGGSFGAGADAAAPEWAQTAAPPPWEGAPPLDLEAPPAQAAEDQFEVSPAPSSEPFGPAPGAASQLFGAPEGDLAAPEENPAAETGGAPELDFSQPDFSGGDREPEGLEPQPEPSAASFDASSPDTEPRELSAAPPLDLEAPPAEAEAPAWEAPAPAAEGAQDDLSFEPPPDELSFEPPADPAAQVADVEDATLLEATEVVEEADTAEAAPDVAGFAEAAAAAVAAESTDLSEMIEAPPDLVGEAAPTVEDFSFDVAEEASAEPPVTGKPSFHAAFAIATAATPVPGTLAAVEPASPEPSTEVDLSFGLEEPPVPTVLAPPAPPAAEMPAEAIAEEEIPTIDGAEILEEIVEDASGSAPPPQSLEFEPLAPEPPAAAPLIAAPPVPAVLAPPPLAASVPPPPAAPEPIAGCQVAGTHRVVVHTVEGLVKRGLLQDPELDAPALALAPQSGTAAEEIATDKVKAIFFMLAPGEKPPPAEGKRVRVTFRDGRQIAGFSPDYREGGTGFFMVPADTKTNTGRIWVYRAAVRQVAVS